MARSGAVCAVVAVASVLAAGCSSGTSSTGAGATPSSGAASATAVSSTVRRSPATTATASTTALAASVTSMAPTGATVTFKAEVWADNWFSLYVNGQYVGEDSVPIATERSFNAETIMFTASYPVTIGMVTKDYRQDDTGLEYIGTPRQQMGDGGFIAQITDTTTGRVVATTGAGWRGLVIHRAPLNEECEKAADPDSVCRFESAPEPAGWAAPGFDDSSWVTATVYTAAQVGTKDGYDTIRWDRSADLIWTSDLKADNTILWRAHVDAP